MSEHKDEDHNSYGSHSKEIIKDHSPSLISPKNDICPTPNQTKEPDKIEDISPSSVLSENISKAKTIFSNCPSQNPDYF